MRLRAGVWCAMLPSCSLGLIADAGTIHGALDRRPARALRDAAFQWASVAAGRVGPPTRGRSMTMFVPAGGVHGDYKARLGRAGITALGRSRRDRLRRRRLAVEIGRSFRRSVHNTGCKDGRQGCRTPAGRLFQRGAFCPLGRRKPGQDMYGPPDRVRRRGRGCRLAHARHDGAARTRRQGPLCGQPPVARGDVRMPGRRRGGAEL